MESLLVGGLARGHRADWSLLIGATVIMMIATGSGCGSVPARFMGKAIERMGDPILPAQHHVSDLLLPHTGLSVLWAGHATVLIQIRDKVFLTDPLFTNTAGMFSRRYIEPGFDPAALSHVDYTLVSHLHFDHFSYGSLDMLPTDGVLLLPFGALAYTPDFGFREIREMQPWESLEEEGLTITAVPVQHFSGRYGVDIPWMRDRGYTGYVIEYGGITVFIGGDTGYHPELFKEIGRRFTIDLAILPIAPVEPRDFMRFGHVDPAEALEIFSDLKARYMMPMHHRTLLQGFDPTDTFPVEQLQRIAEHREIRERIFVLEIGERREILAARAASPDGR
ncbi:MAG: MBL fold metallo-hydrolase [Proteobacteria bacterium]|nr:MBL fold metallo-hydrolase [Pseudomonadota bacterium]